MSPAVRPKPQRLVPAVPTVLAFGSNLGDREATLRAAFDDVAALHGVRLTAVSRLFETPALKLSGVDEDAPRYLNAVALALVQLDPLVLLDALNGIESEHGRVREERWGDRTLDIDIVDMGGAVLDEERITLPHPRAFERAFVLAPWLELDPDAELAGYGRVADLLAKASDAVVPYASAGPETAAGEEQS